jgi:soluble P-type ATPase
VYHVYLVLFEICPILIETGTIRRVIDLTIPGHGALKLNHLVCDVEGTLTVDGRLVEEVFRPLLNLRDRLTLHLITVDAYRQQDSLDLRLGFPAVRIRPGDEAQQKRVYVESLGAGVVVIGQGADDAGMMQRADLGICVLSPEGAALPTLLAADLVVPDVLRALQLLANPLRILNTLRR